MGYNFKNSRTDLGTWVVLYYYKIAKMESGKTAALKRFSGSLSEWDGWRFSITAQLLAAGIESVVKFQMENNDATPEGTSAEVKERLGRFYGALVPAN